LHSASDDGIVVSGLGRQKECAVFFDSFGSNTIKKKDGLMTTAEYLQTPQSVYPQELIFGQLRVAESPTVVHQRVVRDLALTLAPFVRERRLGEVLFAPMDVVLDDVRDLVVQPDLLFVSSDRAHIVTDRVYGPPDVVIEVLSPHPRIGRTSERLEWFARYGVRECWLARLPQKQISVLTLTGEGVSEERTFSRASQIESGVLGEVPLTPLGLYGW
jgi:Uma2 family endonuclease